MAQGKLYKPNDADREFVRRCIVAGTSIEKTAEALNITDDTLRKHFRYEIITSREILKGKAVKTLEDALTDGSLDAAKFVLARIAGWKETAANEVTGKDGAPLIPEDRSGYDLARRIAFALAGGNGKSSG